MAVLYEFTRTPELAGLSIEVELRGERLRPRFIGPWGPWRRTCDHPAFRRHSNACRMQSAEFRRRYIERIPPGASLPYPMTYLDGSRVTVR